MPLALLLQPSGEDSYEYSKMEKILQEWYI